MNNDNVKQKIYPKELHQLDLRSIDKEALYVLDKLTAAGHIAYLVGGGVRDLLLQCKPKDYDISTSAEPETIRKLFRNCILIGKRFRLAHIRFGRKIIEVSTFRSGDTENDALILRDNVWGTQEEDVLRRDFTINGLFYDAANQTVIDYVNGFEDLKKGCLKTIGQPFIRFRQDPVRMLRLIKFKARFGFSVDSDTETALLESKHELIKSSSTRILEEILRMLESGASLSFFHLLTEYGFLQIILPAIASFLESKEDQEIYLFLKELDAIATESKEIDRSIALSCLLFPLFQKRIASLFAGREHPPHLGEIQGEAFSLFHESFDSFFKVPKKIKYATCSILTAQFRLVSQDGKKPKSFRIPNDPDFSLAIQFLEIRARINQDFIKIAKEWKKKFEAKVIEEPLEKKRPRKRKRKRPSSPES